MNNADSAAGMPKCVVIDNAFTWGNDAPPRTPVESHDHLRVHAKGHDDPPSRRARGNSRHLSRALVSDPMIEYLRSLGVTALELLPVHHFVVDRHLAETRLTNYWGYNSIGFFAPDVRYAAGGLGNQVYEFKSMVKTLHSAGIEVILDVVYNHTGEGNHLGPTLSLKGHRQQARTIGSSRTTRASTRTSPAPATASTCCTRARSS